MPAFANTQPATLVVHQVFTSDTADRDDMGTYRLEALNPHAILPDGTQGGTYQWTMTGNQTANLRLSATELGVYRYKLYQYTPVPKDGYSYDAAVYEVVLYANPSGSDIVIMDGAGFKVVDPAFTLSYVNPAPPVPVEPAEPDSGSQSGYGLVLPKTGDALAPYLAVVALASAVSIGLVAYARRKKRKGEWLRVRRHPVGGYSCASASAFMPPSTFLAGALLVRYHSPMSAAV